MKIALPRRALADERARRVADLSDILNDLAVLRALQETALATLSDGLRGAQEARAALSAAIAERTDLPRRFSDDPVQTALLLASTLAGFPATLRSSGPPTASTTWAQVTT